MPRRTGGKQGPTAKQLRRILPAEGSAIGETTVKTYVREWKRQRAEVYVPPGYRPGELGEVDFFEVLVEVAGKREGADVPAAQHGLGAACNLAYS